MGQVKVPGMRVSAMDCGGNCRVESRLSGPSPKCSASRPAIPKQGLHQLIPLLQGGKELGFQLTLEEGRPHLPLGL